MGKIDIFRNGSVTLH